MRSIPRFRSSIPSRARPRITHRHPDGSAAVVEYLMKAKVVGRRYFDFEGNLETGYGLCNLRMHGMAYRLDTPGRLLSATPYSHGLEHGVARQWSDDGRLLGTYRMHRETGIDLWWIETWSRPRRAYLAEVHFLRVGQPDGYESWINENQASVHDERHWRRGELHGIERKWNFQGRLRRGFPKYFVGGAQLTRRQYLRAAATDATLPPFQTKDNWPARSFPAVIQQHLRPAKGVVLPRRQPRTEMQR